MKTILLKDTDYQEQLNALYQRRAVPEDIEKAVAEIVKNVRENGDKAIAEYLARFDKVQLTPEQFRVSQEEIDEAVKMAGPEEQKAVKMALEHIRHFAELTKPQSWTKTARDGVILGEQFSPMERVACYVPGGTAPLVSTAIHTVGIAATAGVPSIVAITPPMKNGKVNPMTLYALREAGATEIYKLGGAYAVAALAYGTETIRKADMIAGPGNAYVAAAKRMVYGSVNIDMVAGPSEIMIIADENANPAFLAADILSQAEHGSGLEQAVLACTSRELIGEVEKEVLRQAEKLTRQEPVRKVLAGGVALIEAASLDDAVKIANEYAPEHLEIQCADAGEYAKKISSAGAIFIGEWTPEPAGDFTAGPSHVLPTGGTGKYFHGLTCADFMRRNSLLQYTKEALDREIDSIVKLASLEGLDAHAGSAAIRRSK